MNASMKNFASLFTTLTACAGLSLFGTGCFVDASIGWRAEVRARPARLLERGSA